MAEYDGSIRIGTKIEVKQAEKELKSLESSISKTADKIASLRSKMDALEKAKTPTQEYQNLQKELSAAEKEMEKMIAQDSKLADVDAKIKKLSQSAAEYAGKMKEVAGQKIPTESYVSLDNQIAKTEKALNKLSKKQEEFLASGGEESSEKYEKMLRDADSLEKELGRLLDSQEKLEQRGLAFTSGIDTEEYKNLSAKYEQVNIELEKQKTIQSEIAQKQAESVQKTIELKSQMNQLVESGKAFTLGTDTEEYAQMSAQMQSLNHQMQADTERQTELQNALSAEEQRLAEIKANATVSDQKILDLLERRKQLMAEIADMERAGVGFGYKEYEDANRELEKINSQIKSYKDNVTKLPEQFKKMKDSAKKAFNAVSDGANKSNKSLSGGFKTILKYGFGIRSLYALFNKIRSGIKEGFSNFMNYSSDFANTIQGMKNVMSTLGNQFAAAFSPIVQLVIPWLTKLISAISTAMTYVAQFFAILGGKSTFTRAKQVQDGYNKSLGGTAAAAKKAYGALAKFDDLDVLQKKDEDEAGGGMGDAVGDMFEEVPVDSKFKDWLDGILEKLKPILDYLKKLKDIFMEGFWDGLGDWEYRWESIKNSLASIKDSLIDIWTDPAVLSAADGWAQSVAYMLGSLVGAIASFGLTIATNLLGGIAKYLEQNKERIKEHLISMFNIWADINDLLSEFFQSFAYVFEAFASENGQQLMANLIGIFTDAFMGVTELASKLIRDILNIFIQPFVDNKEDFRSALEGFLGTLAKVAGSIKEFVDNTFSKINEVYDAHFKPLFDSIANGFSQIVGTILKVWSGSIQPVLDDIAEKFDTLLGNHIQPMVDKAIEFFGQFADTVKALWENWLLPLVNWLIEDAAPSVSFVLLFIGEAFSGVAAIVSDVAGGIIDAVSEILEFLEHVFSKDWESAWNDIVGFVKSAIVPDMEGVGGNIIEGLKNGILGAWESLKESVGNVASSVIDKFKDVLGIHSPSTEMDENGRYMIEGLKNGISATIDSVYALFSPDTWAEIGMQMFNALMATVETFRELWTETFTLWQEENTELFFGYDIWYEQWQNILTAYNDVNAEFMENWKTNMESWWKTMVMPYFTVEQWKTFGTNMKDGIIAGFKVIVNQIAGVLNNVIQLFNSAYKELESTMNALINDYNEKAGVMGTSTLGHVSYKAMGGIKVPALATGTVLRGGNPFMAILNDQPAGHTNIEAPLATIEQAVENVLGRQGYGNERVPVNINLNYDGETFARLSLSDILSEAGRQGYDVKVLGVT